MCVCVRVCVICMPPAYFRYATSGVTSLMLKEAAKRMDLPFQEFVVRQDMGCGSTIGPILSTRLGMRTVDVGIAQLSMHSVRLLLRPMIVVCRSCLTCVSPVVWQVREMCGAADVGNSIRLFASLFKHYSSLDGAVSGGD